MTKVLVSLFVFSTILMAQDSLRIHKGSWMASGSANYSKHYNEFDDLVTRRTEIILTPTYFLTKNIGLGLGVRTWFFRGYNSRNESYHFYPELLFAGGINLPIWQEYVYPYTSVGGIIYEYYRKGENVQNSSALFSKLGVVIFLNEYVAVSPEYFFEYRRYEYEGIDSIYDDYTNGLSLSLKIFWN